MLLKVAIKRLNTGSGFELFIIDDWISAEYKT